MILIFAVTVVVLIGCFRMYYSGADEEVYYHGSSMKIDKLTVRDSPLTDMPVVLRPEEICDDVKLDEDKKYVVIGDPFIGNRMRVFSCPNIYVVKNIDEMVENYNSKKTTKEQFRRHLEAKEKMYKSYTQVSESELADFLKSL